MEVASLDDRVTVGGEFCSGGPIETQRQLKVLFLVDSSNSMRWSDPQDALVDAIEHLTQEHANDPNLGFAILRWGSSRVICENIDYLPASSDPELFTSDPEELALIYARMRQDALTNPDKYLDGTNYELALQKATDYMVTDQARHPAGSLTTSYVIEFITDGMPQSASDDAWQTRDAILASVVNLHDRYGVRLDVFAIGANMVAPPEFMGLLAAMADKGDGQYVQLAAPQDLDGAFATHLVERSFLIDYVASAFFVFNRNLRLVDVHGSGQLQIDSDGDGLSDAQELALGTDISSTDSDGDGLGDLFEQRLIGEFDPLAYDSSERSEEDMQDLDGDGLNSFEERRLGLDPDAADSDKDGIPDDIELIMGLNPLNQDQRSDNDADGVNAWTEVTEHLNPLLDEGSHLRDDLAYRSLPFASPSRMAHGRPCFEFSVSNISLRQNAGGYDHLERWHPRGMNSLDVIVIERPVLDDLQDTTALASQLPLRLSRVQPWVIVGDDGKRDPEAIKLRVESGVFEPY